jgi:hypothetical protein
LVGVKGLAFSNSVEKVSFPTVNGKVVKAGGHHHAIIEANESLKRIEVEVSVTFDQFVSMRGDSFVDFVDGDSHFVSP